jgi:nucleoside-diphosphate-sugar epimerase
VALPGGEAQFDPRASRRVNFDVPLELIRRLDGGRLIYASSIAVLGSEFPEVADDSMPANPDSVYGTHKRMVELAFADAVARGSIQGLALRLPGIVARPRSAEGFGSAFLSDAFHAVREGTTYEVPVAPDATSWLMSARVCAANLLHAAQVSATEAEAVNLPALLVSMDDLLAELDRYGDARGIRFAEQPEVRKVFGSYPPLVAARATRLGFVSDGNIASLVANAGQDVELAERRCV